MRTTHVLAAALLAAASPLAAQDLVVDAVRNCVYYDEPATLAQKAAVLRLQPATRYQVTVSGEAFMSDQTGAQADPFPGVVVNYISNEEDGFAMRTRVARPGETFEFTTPTGSGSAWDFHIMAFFIDPYGAGVSLNRGTYTLRVVRK